MHVNRFFFLFFFVYRPISEITVLLHTNKKSLDYTTKIFNGLSTSPYWEEVNSEIGVDTMSTITAVVDLKEIGNSTIKSINFDVVISFKRGEKNYLLPLGTVEISALDFTGESFDILADEEAGNLLFIKNILIITCSDVTTSACLKE